jgi:hypothetical protein
VSDLLFKLLSLLSIVQGSFLLVVLIQKYKSSFASLLLSLIIAFNVYLSFCILLFYLGEISVSDVYYRIEFQQLFNAPLIYLYVSALSDSNYSFTKKQLFHFIPAMISLLFLCLHLVIRIPFVTSYYKTLFLPAFVMLVYSMLSLYTMLKNWKNFHDWAMNLSRRIFYYTNVLMLLHLVIIKTLLIVLTIQYDLVDLEKYLEIFFVAVITIVAFIVYFFGYFVMLNPVIFTEKIIYKSPNGTKELNFESEPVYHKVLELFEKEKVYLNPNLTLFILGQKLEFTSVKNLSYTIKKHSGCSYYEFLNNYRYSEFIMLLTNQNNNKTTILELALKAGFNSKATFNRVFKEKTGSTPVEYRKALH